MDYVITFSDIMTSVIGLCLGVLTFFIKSWFADVKKADAELKKQIESNNEKINIKIEKLEDRTDGEIANIKKEINDIKGDFATTFVLREDFFRSMNGVEDRIKSMDGKLDKLLVMKKD